MSEEKNNICVDEKIMLERSHKLAKYLLKKYAETINQSETRTIGEIKALVDGSDLSIQSITQEFKPKDYSFQENYLEALKKAYAFVCKNIEYVEDDFGINYWLTPKEVLEAKVCDEEDMSVVLCSLMKALGDDNANIIIAEMSDMKTHSFVTTQIGENYYILDPTQQHEFNLYSGKKPEVMRKFDFKGQKIKKFLYRFNSQKYEQFIDE
jgi:hypothetical protein